MKDQSKQEWLERAVSGNNIIRVLTGLCALSVILELALTRKSLFDFEGYPGFYPLFAVAAGVGAVLAARILRKIVSRPEDYYD